MESFERYAGFFPEAALAMMEREGIGSTFHGHRAADTIARDTPARHLPAAGGWADAILPDVVDEGPAPRVAPAEAAGWRRVATDFTRRIRSVLGQA
jgi:hypothetical protein